MIIRSVTMENIGLFRGTNEFRFVRGAAGFRNKAVVVAGKNGVGKTTLFRAASFALHGASSVGDRVSQRDYAAFIADTLHRTVSTDGTRQRARHGRVSVEITYSRSGIAYTATVTRALHANGAQVSEELFVSSDELDHPARDPQAWVNDLLPPSVADVWLFDAEDLGRLIGAEARSVHLKRTVQRLLGVHLVERLVADLNTYVQKSGSKSVEPLRAKLLEARAALEQATRQRTEVEAELDQVREARAEAVTAVRETEASLAAEGGVFARLRKRNEAEVRDLETSIARLEERLRLECDGLLPIAASRRMHQALSAHLATVGIRLPPSQARDLWHAWLERAFEDPDVLKLLSRDAGLSSDGVHGLKQALAAFDQHAGHARADAAHADEPAVHDLSSSEQHQIHEWLRASGDIYRQQLREVASELTALRDRLAERRNELRRAPDDERLAPLHSRLAEAQRILATIDERQHELLRRHGEVEKRLNDSERQFERVRKEFESAQRHDHGVDLAVRSRNAATVFEDALVQHKLNELEHGILRSFNAVCRKQHLLSGVKIDKKSFRTTLVGYRGHELALEEFSAGERQLYNMAVFKALREISGLELPLFIDTPFARLDATHRQRLVGGFFQSFANQIVLFITDAEGQALESTSDLHLEQDAYWLEADPTQQATAVTVLGIEELIRRARGTVAA